MSTMSVATTPITRRRAVKQNRQLMFEVVTGRVACADRTRTSNLRLKAAPVLLLSAAAAEQRVLGVESLGRVPNATNRDDPLLNAA